MQELKYNFINTNSKKIIKFKYRKNNEKFKSQDINVKSVLGYLEEILINFIKKNELIV